MTNTVTDLDRFPVTRGEPLRFDENYEVQSDPHTATVFCLIVNVGPTIRDVIGATDAVWSTGAENLIATYGGDSFAQWCEPAVDGEDRALHVEFSAPDVDVAVQAARLFAQAVGVTSGFKATLILAALVDVQFEVFDLTPEEQVVHQARLAALGILP